MSKITTNTTSLLTILETINMLPNAGAQLPELSNPASAAQILSGYESIDQNGKKITGAIETKTESDLTASGATVTVPAGYYATQASKAISSGSAKTKEAK